MPNRFSFSCISFLNITWCNISLKNIDVKHKTVKMYKNLAKRLKQMRKTLGLSQLEMAQKMGLQSQTQVSRFENGNNLPSLECLYNFSSYYKIDLNWLVFGQESNNTEKHSSADHIDLIYSEINLLSMIARKSIEIVELIEKNDPLTALKEAHQQRTVINTEMIRLTDLLRKEEI
jgi:transcriptional regulator with XRE-family HTH domain